jgi:hypothetical protein
LKETRPLWPPQRGVGLQEPNLGKTNPRVTLHLLAICFPPSLSLGLVYSFLTLTRLVVVFIFVNFSFALFTPPPLGDYHPLREGWPRGDEDGTCALLGPLASLSHVDACNPLLQAHPTWARDEHEGRGISTSLTPSPATSLPPFALGLASTHLGWGTRRHSLVGLGTPRSRNADRWRAR